MARLYIKHEPSSVPVRVGNRIYSDDGDICYFYVDACEVSDFGIEYICFVHENICWAAREKDFYSSGRRAAFMCVPFNNDPSGRLMLLKDMLLD